MPKIVATPKNAYRGSRGGSIGNLFSYSVAEDATPLNPADSSGSVGSITLTAVETVDVELMMGHEFTLTDPNRGAVAGVPRTVARAGGRATITAESLLGALNTERTFGPAWGSLAQTLSTYMSSCGIGWDEVSVDPIYLEYQVAYPGWSGNVWAHIKMLLTAVGAEVAIVGGVITLRQVGIRQMSLNTTASIGTSVTTDGAAQSVEIFNYNTRVSTSSEVAFTSETAYNVAIGEVNTFRVTLDASLMFVDQPSFVSDPGSYMKENPSKGFYTISGGNGLPVPPEWWFDKGGSVHVALTDNPFEIEVVITAPAVDYVGVGAVGYAPFRLAVGEDGYPALRITGLGVFTKKELVTLQTGASPETTSTLVGATIDNPFMQNMAETLTAGLRAACAFAGPTKTMNFSQKSYDRGNQEFGNVGGSMVNYGSSRYRVRANTIDAENISGSAESAVTFADFNQFYSGFTMSDFGVRFPDYTFGQQSTTPLKQAS